MVPFLDAHAVDRRETLVVASKHTSIQLPVPSRSVSLTTGRSGILFEGCSPVTRLKVATDQDPTVSPDPTLNRQPASVSHRATSTPPRHRDRRRPAVPATRRSVAPWQHHRGPPSYPYRSPPRRGHRALTLGRGPPERLTPHGAGNGPLSVISHPQRIESAQASNRGERTIPKKRRLRQEFQSDGHT